MPKSHHFAQNFLQRNPEYFSKSNKLFKMLNEYEILEKKSE